MVETPKLDDHYLGYLLAYQVSVDPSNQPSDIKYRAGVGLELNDPSSSMPHMHV